MDSFNPNGTAVEPLQLGAFGSSPPRQSLQKGNRTRKDPSVQVIACRQCYSRKVKCDSGRPICKNCTKRGDPCEYDEKPKRRGPDKQPGARVKIYRMEAHTVNASESSTKKAKKAPTESLAERRVPGKYRTIASKQALTGDVGIDQPSASVSTLATSSVLSSQGPQAVGSSCPSGMSLSDTDLNASMHTAGSTSFEALLEMTEQESILPTPEQFEIAPITMQSIPSIASINEATQQYSQSILPSTHQAAHSVYNSPYVAQTHIPRGLSGEFYRVTWWEALLPLYSPDTSQAVIRIYQDLNLLLNNAGYWLSFINLQQFIDSVFDPNRRIFMQPSIVLSALAFVTLMKSSEMGLGKEGREFADCLRDAAQSSLEASLNVSWIEPSLAQAAFFLVLFEASSHPKHTSARALSALRLLDSLIQALNLTRIDAHEIEATTFAANEIPSLVSSSPFYISEQDGSNALTALGGQSNKDWKKLFIPKEWPDPREPGEMQKEESRRLCWSSIMLFSALTESCPHFGAASSDFFVTKHENLALFFPGEAIIKGKAKESIFALHCRAALLWNSCNRLRMQNGWHTRRAELVGKAWMEANEIENALSRHQCPFGEGIWFAGREYLFQLKIIISNNFTRLIPLPHTLHFERDSAKEWLSHREVTAIRVRKFAHFVTRVSTNAIAHGLSKRPLSVWWAMYQIQAGLLIWKSDTGMDVALRQSLDFLAITDFLTVMWPSEHQGQQYAALRTELLNACVIAGIRIPEPVPIPGLPEGVSGTMIPSPFFSTEPSALDISMAPLD